MSQFQDLCCDSEYFTFTEHRHVTGEPPQREAKSGSRRSAVAFDEGRHQPHGHKVVYPTIDKCRRQLIATRR
jgi:hypothetical protein